MPCLWLRELHPASQEHKSALNVDPQVPHVGVWSGFRLNTHVASGGNCIATYAFSPAEPHSSVQVLQLHCLLCSSTPHHHCPPHSGWSGAARSSGCCTVCQTACRHSTDCQGQPGREKGNRTWMCRLLMSLQMATSFNFDFQPRSRREGAENAEFSFKIQVLTRPCSYWPPVV